MATLEPQLAGSPNRPLQLTVLGVPARSRQGVDRFEVCVLAAFAALSMWVVAVNLWLAAKHGLVWTGIDGEFPVDQMQYLAWIRDASRHLFVSDLFALRPTSHDYLQPMVAASGGLAALGVAPWLALLVWKPAAVVAIFFAVRAYMRRLFRGRGEQRAALVLGLFAAGYGARGDEWLPFMSWGYVFGLVAVAAMVWALVAYDRSCRSERFALLPAALGLVASWLHPWQGELLILVIVGAELLQRLAPRELIRGRSARLAATTVAATALPLIYYEVLERQDPAWRLAASVTARHPASLATIMLPLLGLGVAALPAYRRPASSFLETATRLWPPAALAVWAVEMAGGRPGVLHAWTGITIPLAALAVQGVQAIERRRVPGYRHLATVGVLALTLPGSLFMMRATSQYIMPATHNQNLNATSEQQAFAYLAHDPQPGGVLSSYYLGDEVPGETGHRTYSGDYRWSGRAYATHAQMAWELLHGWIRGRTGRAFVVMTGARFVLTDCRTHTDLAHTLGPLLQSTDRFGCTTVYELRSS
jgi:hypothetical protein